MSFIDKLGLGDADKAKIVEMGASDESSLVSAVRASETACRSHLGTNVVDLILSTFSQFDHGKVPDKEMHKMGLFLDPPDAKA